MESIIEVTKNVVDTNISSYDYIKDSLKAYILWALDNQKEFYYIDLYNSSVYKKFDKIHYYHEKASFTTIFEKGRSEGVFKNIPVDLAISFWTKASNGVAAYAVENELNSNDSRIEHMVSLLMDGISNKK